jgi:hypothetical protein
LGALKLPRKVSDAARTVNRYTSHIVHGGYIKLLKIRATLKQVSKVSQGKELSYVVADG